MVKKKGITMELDLRFKQYELNMDAATVENGEQVAAAKPHQELINYFEGNPNLFSYKEMRKLVQNVSGIAKITLTDGTKVVVANRQGIVNIAMFSPNGNKYIATWSNIVDDKEFQEKCRDYTKQ